MKEDERLNSRTILNDFLCDYINSGQNTTSDILYDMIYNYTTEEKDWRYYFIKYKAITSANFGRMNLFSWDDPAGFNINSLGNSNVQPLSSYHLNPHLIAVRERLIENGVDSKKIQHYYGRFSDELSFLSLPMDINIYVGYGCFEIYNLFNLNNYKYIIDEFDLEQVNDCYILKEFKGKNKIETAILFCTKVLQSNN